MACTPLKQTMDGAVSWEADTGREGHPAGDAACVGRAVSKGCQCSLPRPCTVSTRKWDLAGTME